MCGKYVSGTKYRPPDTNIKKSYRVALDGEFAGVLDLNKIILLFFCLVWINENKDLVNLTTCKKYKLKKT